MPLKHRIPASSHAPTSGIGTPRLLVFQNHCSKTGQVDWKIQRMNGAALRAERRSLNGMASN